ncbi:Mitotic spindle checkpoint component mad2 [Lobosporangium transversale]|nr:Mitotic spindle checkpoint component mad2 [Lobosporangium transversale]
MTVLERWQFDIQNTKDSSNNNTMSAGQQQSFSTPSSSSMFNNVRSNENITDPTLPSSNKQKAEKTEKEIQAEIQAILRQITASVTFLPMLDEKCTLTKQRLERFCGTWTILCQTEKDAEVPATWSDADPHLVHNAEQVKLRSFSTKLHRVDALVAYRLQDDL